MARTASTASSSITAYALFCCCCCCYWPGLVLCTLDDHPDSFWMSAELLSVQWRKGCLTTAGCAEPRFQVTKLNTGNNQAASISWPVILKLVEDGSHLFISYWSSGNLDEIALKCEVTGLDPAYRFPRVCDTTDTKRVFGDHRQINLRDINEKTDQINMKKRKAVLEISGKCFNASLTIQHYDYCPTCMQHQSVAIVEQYSNLDSGWMNAWGELQHHHGEHFLYALLILCVLTATLSTGFACLLVAFIRQKRRLKNANPKLRLQDHHNKPLSTINRPSHFDENGKYEIPWEDMQTYRQTPKFCINGRSSFKAIPPIEVPNTYGGPFHELIRKKPTPSSSFGERHDDSGLDSV